MWAAVGGSVQTDSLTDRARCQALIAVALTEMRSVGFGHRDRWQRARALLWQRAIRSDGRRLSTSFTAIVARGHSGRACKTPEFGQDARVRTCAERGDSTQVGANRRVLPSSVPDARCPGLQDITGRGIYAGNRVCVCVDGATT